MKNIFFIFLCVILVSSCAVDNRVWIKRNGEMNTFNEDKLQCIEQSQQQVSAFSINQYQGVGGSSVQTNNLIFKNCMSAKGYDLVSQQEINNLVTQNQIKIDEEKQFLNKNKEKIIAICNEKKYSLIMEKTSCEVKDITLKQLVDNSKITNIERDLMIEMEDRVHKILNDEEDFLRNTNRSIVTKNTLVYTIKFRKDNEKNLESLLNNKITWGEYNKTRKENFEDYLNNFQNSIKNLQRN